MTPPNVKDLLLAPRLDPQQVIALLSPYGFKEPTKADANLQALADDAPARRSLADILEDLLDNASQSADPDQAINYLERFSAHVGDSGQDLRRQPLYGRDPDPRPALSLLGDRPAGSLRRQEKARDRARAGARAEDYRRRAETARLPAGPQAKRDVANRGARSAAALFCQRDSGRPVDPGRSVDLCGPLDLLFRVAPRIRDSQKGFRRLHHFGDGQARRRRA